MISVGPFVHPAAVDFPCQRVCPADTVPPLKNNNELNTKQNNNNNNKTHTILSELIVLFCFVLGLDFSGAWLEVRTGAGHPINTQNWGRTPYEHSEVGQDTL